MAVKGVRGALPTFTRLHLTVTLTRLPLTATLTRLHLTERPSIRIQIDPDPDSDPEKPCLLSVLSIRHRPAARLTPDPFYEKASPYKQIRT